MKKNFFLVIAMMFVFTSTFSYVKVNTAAKNANEIFFPIGSTGKKISLMEISKINVNEFEKISGRNMNFLDKIAFKAGQRKLRKSISEDGTINNKKLNKLIAEGDHSSGFHLGGFALGFFLGLIGVVLAYVIGGDEATKKNRAKWSWIGLGVAVVLYVILYATLINRL